MNNIYITQKIPAAAENLFKKAGFIVKTNKTGQRLTKTKLMQKLKKVDAVLCLLSDVIDAEVIESLENCRIIANYAVGYNNIDIQTAKKRGIIVTNTPDVLTDATADLAFALILATARHIVTGDMFMRQGNFTGWDPFLFRGIQLSSAKFGIVGAGRIGSAVAKRAHAFGAKIIYYANSPKPELERDFGAVLLSLDELMHSADIISIHTPLNNSTRLLINKRRLNLMKRNAIIINTARGEVIDEKHLIYLLQKKKIAGAGLDVYDGEPKINPDLLTLKNAVLAPHTGSATFTSRDAMAEIAANNIISVLSGKDPITPVI